MAGVIRELQLAENGFEIANVSYDSALLRQGESRIAKLVREGDEEGLQRFIRGGELPELLYPQADIGLARLRCMELLCLARTACLEGGGAANWCYYHYYWGIEKMQDARTQEALSRILENRLLLYTGGVRRINADRMERYSPVINSCIRHIRQHMPGKITVQMMARELHLSPKYLSALFRRETGRTMTEYITDMRVEEAGRLLTQTDLPISEISIMLSFCSQSYFNSVFRERTGLTPRACRYSGGPDQALD